MGALTHVRASYGRVANRREACRIAAVVPTVELLNGEDLTCTAVFCDWLWLLLAWGVVGHVCLPADGRSSPLSMAGQARRNRSGRLGELRPRRRLPGASSDAYTGLVDGEGAARGMGRAGDDRPVRVLHLSDVHFRASKSWDADPVLRALTDFVGERSGGD